jgi:peptide/nickel transport system substrate-binding protein
MAACQAQHPGAGGYLTVGVGQDPLTWNRLLATERVTTSITDRIHASLVRVNRQTQEVEPELAESWSFSDDGTVLTFHLRRGVRFSDGEPFTAEDVAFTFRALHDPDVGSPFAENAKIEGVPLFPEVLDPETVRFRLPRRTAVVERLFDGLSMLPRHRLEAPLEQGDFVSAYGIGARTDDIVGLGPFVLERYLPGRRVVLRRNPLYWKRGAKGEPLPRLDGIIFEVLPDSNARMLKFLAGELDIQGELLPEDFISLTEKTRAGLRLLDLGPGMVPERMWFNLNPSSPSVSERKRVWFEDERFRRGVSLSIDRRSLVEAVYHGLASPALGPVSPANKKWRNEDVEPPKLDRDEARRLFRSAGFLWNERGRLITGDGDGEEVGFTLATNADNRRRTQMVTLIQDDLDKLGITINLALLDGPDLVGRVTRSYDYEACLLGISPTDPDPSSLLPLWLSRGPMHFWNPHQKQPATEWESRIDELMEAQMVELDRDERKRLYGEVQAILAEKLPLLNLVVPHVCLGVSSRVRNLKPTPFWTPPLWNCEEIYVSAEPEP